MKNTLKRMLVMFLALVMSITNIPIIATSAKSTVSVENETGRILVTIPGVTGEEIIDAVDMDAKIYKDNKEVNFDKYTNVTTGMELVTLSDGKIESSKDIAVLGDIDGDGEVDVSDARLVLRAAVKLDVLTGAWLTAANVDRVDGVSVSDARLVLRVAVKLDVPEKTWLNNGVKVWIENDEEILNDGAKKELENIEKLNNGVLPDIEYDEYNSIDWLYGNYYAGTITNESEAINSLNSIRNLLKISDANEEFKCRYKDKKSTVYRLQQYYKGYEVVGAERIVSVDESSKTIDSINGSNIPAKNINTTINYSKKQILELLEKQFSGKFNSVIDTVIYKAEGLNYEIAYEINSNTESAKTYYVSAKDAKILGSSTSMYFERVVASGTDNNNRSRNFYSEKINDNLYYLADYNKNITVSDAGNKDVKYRVEGDGLSVEYDSVFYHFDSWLTKAGIIQSKKNKWNNKKAVSLMANLSEVYDYYLEVIGIHGFNDKNGKILGIINDNKHNDRSNAYSVSCPLLKSTIISMGVNNKINFDTVAHEYTHSVVGSIVDLDYKGESGAISEAYADIMGELAEGDSTWTHGDRVLSNPDINNYPSYYKGEYWCESSNDDVVVHTNSTVIGYAVYLMSKYGELNNDILAKIVYNSIRYLEHNSDFYDCKTAMIEAARELNCNGETINVINSAFCEVGIYDGRGTISGAVKDENSKEGLESIIVRFKSGILNYSTKTDESGNFKITLPVGCWEISIEDTDTYWCSEKTSLTVEKGKNITVAPAFYMKKETKVQGRVLDSSTKAPIANASVEVFDSSNSNIMIGPDGTYNYADFKKRELITSTTTDENGNYSFDLPSGKYALAVNHEDYNFNGILFTLEQGLDDYFAQNVLLTPKGEVDGGDYDEDIVFAGGDGTEENPYQVETPAQLNAVRYHLDKHFIQIADIDLSDLGEWKPIGMAVPMYATTGNSCKVKEELFTGTYNGNNYRIDNIKITDGDGAPEYDCYGLFAGTKDATLKNINVTNLNIDISKSGADYPYIWKEEGMIYSVCAGGIAGICKKSNNGITVIDNCLVTGKIHISPCADAYVGGITGYGGTFTRCKNYADIDVYADSLTRYEFPSSKGCCGGITGHPNSVNGKIDMCTNYGNVFVAAGVFLFSGGISGIYGQISNSLNFGRIGGNLLHYGASSTSFQNCNVGGIVGATGSDFIKNCINYGEIYGIDVSTNNSKYSGSGYGVRVGGICGQLAYYNGRLISCYNLGKYITANQEHAVVGRIAGSCSNRSDCYSWEETFVNNSITTASSPTSDEVSRNVNGGNLTKEEMLKEETYKGFDFDNIWKIDSSVGGAVLK